jgi:hypothetical protein
MSMLSMINWDGVAQALRAVTNIAKPSFNLQSESQKVTCAHPGWLMMRVLVLMRTDLVSNSCSIALVLVLYRLCNGAHGLAELLRYRPLVEYARFYCQLSRSTVFLSRYTCS